MRDRELNIRRTSMSVASLAIIVILVSSYWGIQWLESRNIESTVLSNLTDIQRLFQNEIVADSRLYHELIKELMQQKEIEQAWSSKNRDSLFQLTIKKFNQLKIDHDVSHLYFIEPDKTCFLRVHNPRRYGDVIKRATMDKAYTLENSSFGVDLGPYGTFTLRVVEPWIVDGNRIGFIEMGHEINHFISEISELIEVDVYFIIEKYQLSREKWEEGQSMTGGGSTWEDMDNFTVIEHSIDKVPPALLSYLKPLLRGHKGNEFVIKVESRTLHGAFIPLNEASGNRVGDIVVLTDVTNRLASSFKLYWLLVLVTLVIGACLLTFLWKFTGNIEKELAISVTKPKEPAHIA